MNSPAPIVDAPVSFRHYAFRSAQLSADHTYFFGHKFFVDDLHPSLQQNMSARAANTFLTGQLLAQTLAKVTRFSVEEVAGELGGQEPMEDDHPCKELLVRTAASLVNVVWAQAPVWAKTLSEYLGSHLAEEVLNPGGAFPEIEPYIDGQRFNDLRLLYRPRGGMFTLLAGFIFDYGPGQRWVLLYDDMEGKPGAPEAAKLIRRLLAFRNRCTDESAVEVLEGMAQSVIAEVGEDILKIPEVEEVSTADAVPTNITVE